MNPVTLEEGRIELPAGGWVRKPNGTLRYLDGACRVVVKPTGKLVVRCLGTGGFTLDEQSQGQLGVQLELGSGGAFCAGVGGSPIKDWGTLSGRFGLASPVSSPRERATHAQGAPRLRPGPARRRLLAGREPCVDSVFLTDGKPFTTGYGEGAAGVVTLEAGEIRLEGVCDEAVIAKVKAKKRFDTVKGKWEACAAFPGKVKLKAKLDAETCQAMEGSLGATGVKPRKRKFTSRSRGPLAAGRAERAGSRGPDGRRELPVRGPPGGRVPCSPCFTFSLERRRAEGTGRPGRVASEERFS